MGQFSVSACANQPPGFSVSETSTPNRLFQTMIELKMTPLTILNFLVTIKISYFSLKEEFTPH